MNYNLTAEAIKEIKTQFAAWLELQDEKASLAEAEKDCKTKAASIFEGKVGDAGKLFKAMKKMYDGEENELDELGSVLECIRSNGADEDVDTDGDEN
jgi:hypothetical protein